MNSLSFSANLVLSFLLVVTISAAAPTSLKYQSRGSYHEGIKPLPSGGADIELISARVDYIEPGDQDPDAIKVRFYLPTRSEVYLTVRELDVRHYYWLDRVVPPDRWQADFSNVFEWPTSLVLRPLQLGAHDLAVVARMHHSEPSAVEEVAPALLYHLEAPSSVSAYLFAFKLNIDARLQADVYAESSGEKVFTEAFPRKHRGRPFTIWWDASSAPEGPYRLVIAGRSLINSEPVDQTVYFYHQPRIEDE